MISKLSYLKHEKRQFLSSNPENEHGENSITIGKSLTFSMLFEYCLIQITWKFKQSSR